MMTVGMIKDRVDISRDAARLAMRYLLEGDNHRKEEYWRHRDTQHCLLLAHPFGLDTTVKPVTHMRPDLSIRLMAYPGYTDLSVHAMQLMLLHEISQYVSQAVDPYPMHPIRLRIVRAEVGGEGHLVYFELITVFGTFMSGGCNDFSGEAGRGREKLETMFAFVAALCGVTVEDVTIPHANAVGVDGNLKDTYNAFKKRRRELEEGEA